MSFTTIPFLIFLPVVTIIYYICAARFRWIFLCSASILFYGYWDFRYIPLILLSSFIDYICAHLIYINKNNRGKKIWLVVTIISNLSILIFFKYWNFIGSNILSLMGNSFELHNLLIPLGLSFYTLQTLSYSFDVYKNKIIPEQHFGYYFLYVIFFPQLVAGPIERSNRLLPQLKKLSLPSTHQFRYGILLISWGCFIKLVVADNLTPFIESVYFFKKQHDDGLVVIFASALIMIKVYCDFMAYSEIARGVAKLYGVNLTINFSRPFFSKNLAGFWQRWHITLTRWLVDYVQIPLLRRFPSEPFRSIVSIFTLCLIGLWHGASWNFLLFGLIHGVALCLWRPVADGLKNLRRIPPIMRNIFSHIMLKSVLILTAPIFYLTDVTALGGVFIRMAEIDLNFHTFLINSGKLSLLIALSGIVVIFTIEYVAEKKCLDTIELIYGAPRLIRISGILLMVFFSILFGAIQSEPFVYFNF